MDWINIQHTHPEFGVPVLVYGKGEIHIARLEVIQKTITKVSFEFQKLKFEFRARGSGYDSLWTDVTHWMPLPDPPEQ